MDGVVECDLWGLGNSKLGSGVVELLNTSQVEVGREQPSSETAVPGVEELQLDGTIKSLVSHSRLNLSHRPQRGRISSHLLWLALQRVLAQGVLVRTFVNGSDPVACLPSWSILFSLIGVHVKWTVEHTRPAPLRPLSQIVPFHLCPSNDHLFSKGISETPIW